jgi:hypothetical protein
MAWRRSWGGGEEFCLLPPNADIRRALQIGETVRLTAVIEHGFVRLADDDNPTALAR